VNAALRVAAVFDLDGTLIHGSAERRLIRHLLARRVLGVRHFGRALLRVIGHLGSPEAMFLTNKAYLRGIAASTLEHAAEDLFGRRAPDLVPEYLKAWIEDHRARGHILYLLSGAPEPLLRPFALRLGFDAFRGTRLVTQGGRLTGEIDGVHPYGLGKRALLEEAALTLGFDQKASYAYADRGSDRFLLESVGHPVAVNPDHELSDLARERGWPVLPHEQNPRLPLPVFPP
jgi:putative phosphoserine phosphatase / 1-acylglycerol-3-phosphate O-acyltransferase